MSDPSGGAMAAAGLAGGLASGWLNYQGQKEANQTNVEIANATNAWNAEQAFQNRNWQQYMSNTAHQRSVEDLKKAGLNPILAAQNGASTPSGGAASATAPTVQSTRMGDMLTGALTSAIEVKRLGMEMQNQQADLALKKAQVSNIAMDTTVKSKDLPKADIMNEAYGAAKSILNKIKAPIMNNFLIKDALDFYGIQKKKPINLNKN